MKIEFLQNKKLENKPEEYELIKEVIFEFEIIDEDKIWFIRDDRTKFEKYNEKNRFEDIKSVFMIFKNKNEKYRKIKGNLTFKQNNHIEFYPIFVDKFNTHNPESKYLCEIKYKKNYDGVLEMMSSNEEEYEKLLKEISNDSKLQPKDSVEWNDFIEPYQYFVDLKNTLIKKEFEMFENFGETIKVIFINSNNKKYSEKFNEENKLASYNDNRNNFFVVDYEKYLNIFDQKYLKDNKMFLSISREEWPKIKKQEAENRIREINNKISRGGSKLSYFTSNESKENKLDILTNFEKNKDSEVSVNNFFATNLMEEFEILDLGYSLFSRNIKKIKDIKVSLISNVDIKEIKNLISKFNISKDEIIEQFKKTINLISKNLDYIYDDDVEKINYLNDELMKFIKNFNEPFKIETISIEEEIKNEILIKRDKLISDKEKEINFIENEISELNDKKNKSSDKKEIIKIENSIKLKNKQIENINDKFLNLIFEIENNTHKNIKFTLQLKELIDEKLSFLNQIENFNEKILKETTIRKIKYYFDKVIIFSKINSKFDNQKNEDLKKCVYLLNTGDLVLVNTIKQIINKVKKSQEMNDEMLSKIIRKIPLKNFIENDTNINNCENKLKEELPSYFKLNDSQKDAFRLAIDKSEILSIIQGPPGTGKTKIITELIKYFSKRDEKVIVSSQTNVAIENVLKKTNSNDILVISPWITTKISEKFSISKINEIWYDNFKLKIKNLINKNENYSNLDFSKISKEVDIFRNINMSKNVNVFGATTTTSKTLPNRPEYRFIKDAKVLIIDEVSKSILPEILRYALDVEKVILVGDHKQLNPIFDLKKDQFDNGEIEESKFDDLKKEIETGIFYKLAKDAKNSNRIKTLNVNYRSLPGVLDAYNVFYEEEGNLKPNRKFEEFKKHDFKNSKYFNTNKNFYFFDLKGAKEEKRGNSRYNISEINQIEKILIDLYENLNNIDEKEIAIIFPYSAQIFEFSKLMNKKHMNDIRNSFKSIKWDTVDSFQGSEADIVVLSTVLTEVSNNNFMTDFRRVNVALSRAKDMLIVLGNKLVLENLEIGGEGIKRKKYFQKILDESENKRLEIKKVRLNNEN